VEAAVTVRVLDVVLPAYQEEQALPVFVRELVGVLATTGTDWRIHIVLDRSRDGTEGAIRALCAAEPRIRGLLLSARFGHQESLLAGVAAARRDAWVLMMDSDGQHPPSVVPELLRAADGETDVVATRRLSTEKRSFVTALCSDAFYRVLSAVSGIRLEPGMADFRLVSPRVAEVLRSGLSERAPFLRGLVEWMGFRQRVVEYRATGRIAGRTKYTLRRRLSFARKAITAFSQVPLRVAAPLGLTIAAGSLVYAAWLAVGWFRDRASLPPGWVTLATVALFLGGLQLAFIGILGEYLAHVHDETRRRPRFIVREAVNYVDGEPPLLG
jgi:dolichol-phosphate mannosyltransferase